MGLMPRYPLLLSLSKDARPECPWFDRLTMSGFVMLAMRGMAHSG